MMSTYLIFFGKSQDFTFHAFDDSKYINDFNSIIKDFDELESKTFTVDDISNKDILSKYIFNKNGKNYSLLKLYSLGQAFNGSRISGSIYGVALLSENDIKISETNLAILNSAKKNFSNLCLEGLKFKSSDFYNDAVSIWSALVNHSDGNYLNKIDYNNKISNLNKRIKAFNINDLTKNPIELNNEISNTSRLYFSADIDHLKRTQSKWGKDQFPIYIKENNKYNVYIEKQSIAKPSKPIEDISLIRKENEELKEELDNLSIDFQMYKKNATFKFLIASVLAFVFFLSVIALIVYYNYIDKNKNKENVVNIGTNNVDFKSTISIKEDKKEEKKGDKKEEKKEEKKGDKKEEKKGEKKGDKKEEKKEEKKDDEK